MQVVLAGASCWIGDWRCRGEQRAWVREVSYHGTIELQREGGHVREVGRTQHAIDATTVSIQPAGEGFRIASPSGRPQRSTVLLIAGELAATPSVRRVSPATARLHHRLIGARDPMAREEAALALIQAVLETPAPSAPPTRASWRRVVDEVLHVIATRHGEPLTLAMLAQGAGVSSFHLSRVFRAVTGVPVHQHLVRVRLRVALHALREGGELSQLALAAGFSSHSHFTSAFRAEFGAPPSTFVAGRSR